MHVRTTHEKYLVVFIIVQTLAEIVAVHLILIFRAFGLEMRILTPGIRVLDDLTPDCEVLLMTP